MKRIPLIVLAILMATLYVVRAEESSQAAKTEQPNILVILADDMGWGQPGYQGGAIIPTPSIDSLAREGTSLTQFYVQPVCTPTRAAFLTGRYAFRNGSMIRFGFNNISGMLQDERTIAEALQDAGYWTAIVGKWHLGSWQKEHLPMQRGFDYQYGHYAAVIDYKYKMRGDVYDWHRNEEPLDEDGYSTDLIGAEAARLIKEHDGTKPFFMYVPFNAPHGPHTMAPEEVTRKYSKEKVKSPGQAANVEIMDKAIGRILDAVDAKGIRDNTLVVFFNDNGGPKLAVHRNGPYKGYKTEYYEGGVRVACLLRWPDKLEAGSTNDEMFNCVDLYPTLLNLAGASLEQPLPLDGYDIWKSLTEGTPSPRTEIAHSTKTIRMGDWKYIDETEEYYSFKAEVSQLYNIAEDPGEENNLVDQYPEKVEEFKSRMAYWAALERPAEEFVPIAGYPVYICGEEENAILSDALKEKIDRIRKSGDSFKSKYRLQAGDKRD